MKILELSKFLPDFSGKNEIWPIMLIFQIFFHYAIILILQTGLLLGLCNHLQVVGEHPTCMYGDLAFFLVSVII